MDEMDSECEDEVREFPFPYLNKYFELKGVQSKENMSVKCKLCVGNKILKSAWSTASNLRKHIQVSIARNIIKY